MSSFPSISRKGQSAIEFLGIAVIGMAFFVSIFVVTMDSVTENTFRAAVGDARNLVNSLADSADNMCIQPDGRKVEVLAAVPESLNTTESVIENRTVQVVVQSGDRQEFVTATAKCTLNGTIPETPGPHLFVIKKTSTAVNITPKG